jgi:hypothetical protein
MRSPARRFAYVTAIIFSGTLIAGIVVMLSLMASACVVSRVIRCFSISRDTVPAILGAAKIWFFPALIIAFLIAMIVHVQNFLVWWTVLIAALVSMVMWVLILLILGAIYLSDAPVPLLVGSVVLFVGAQLSIVIARSVGKLAT